MKQFFCCLIACFSLAANAQYYYNDVVSNKQSQEHFLQLKKNKIKRVAASSIDPDDAPTEGFAILQDVNSNKNELITRSKSSFTNTSILIANYLPDGRLASTTDSTEAAVSTTAFAYDAATGFLINITSVSRLPGEAAVYFKEERKYSYNGNKLASMWRIKNSNDSLQVVFIQEEHGWVGEEQWLKKGKLTETYFYYYEADGLLSDVARYNNNAKRILPEYAFEYDEKNRLSTMVAFISGRNQYRKWYYSYDDRNLKLTEAVYINKYNQPEGRISFDYQ